MYSLGVVCRVVVWVEDWEKRFRIVGKGVLYKVSIRKLGEESEDLRIIEKWGYSVTIDMKVIFILILRQLYITGESYMVFVKSCQSTLLNSIISLIYLR